MSPAAILSIFITSLFIFSNSPAVAGDKTAYEALEDYDFPVGLLPKGATTYELNEGTGQFKVYINEVTCSFSIKGYHLKYKSTISGVITKDRIKNLKGISVKVLRLWVNIVEISRQQDKLYFSAGIVSADFTVKTFAKSPQCGCGFNCGGKIVERRDVNLKRYVSSL